MGGAIIRNWGRHHSVTRGEIIPELGGGFLRNQQFNSTVVRAHVSAAGAKGGKKGKRSGRSRGGFATKIHAKSDASGDIIAFDLTGGEASDGRHFETLLDIGPDIQPPRRHLATKATPATPIGTPRERAASLPSFPIRPTKGTNRPSSPGPSTRPAHRIEQGVGRLKRFKRVALRCEKTARNFRWLWCKCWRSAQESAREHYADHAARTAFQISGAVLFLTRSLPSLN